MKRLRRLPMLAGLAAFSSACFAAGPAIQAAPPQGQAAPGPSEAPASQPLTKICLDVETKDPLTKEFALRLRGAIAASGALSLAAGTDACGLKLHVPGNLLRFETAGGVMVSTVVIVTSASGRYLSASVSACRANDLKPCAVRAVAVTKLAALVSSSGGT